MVEHAVLPPGEGVKGDIPQGPPGEVPAEVIEFLVVEAHGAARGAAVVDRSLPAVVAHADLHRAGEAVARGVLAGEGDGDRPGKALRRGEGDPVQPWGSGPVVVAVSGVDPGAGP